LIGARGGKSAVVFHAGRRQSARKCHEETAQFRRVSCAVGGSVPGTAQAIMVFADCPPHLYIAAATDG
jgi:hypothetical protein